MVVVAEFRWRNRLVLFLAITIGRFSAEGDRKSDYWATKPAFLPCRRVSPAASHALLQGLQATRSHEEDNPSHRFNTNGGGPSSQRRHTLNGIEFVEVFIPALPIVGNVTILEATAAAQDTLVDLAILGEEEEEEGTPSGGGAGPLALPTGDPYGTVLWPAASVVAHALLPLLKEKHSTVLELGAGTGLISLACLRAGARRVIATDYEQLPLDLLHYAATRLDGNQPLRGSDGGGSTESPAAATSSHLECALLDMCATPAEHPLPVADFVVAADVMYEPKTGQAVARRVVEALSHNATVLVGDSPGRAGRPAFLRELRRLLLLNTDKASSHSQKLDFVNVSGWTVQGPRHALICGPESSTVTPVPQALTVALLVLRPEEYHAAAVAALRQLQSL